MALKRANLINIVMGCPGPVSCSLLTGSRVQGYFYCGLLWQDWLVAIISMHRLLAIPLTQEEHYLYCLLATHLLLPLGSIGILAWIRYSVDSSLSYYSRLCLVGPLSNCL